jgi:hypothetical protein
MFGAIVSNSTTIPSRRASLNNLPGCRPPRPFHDLNNYSKAPSSSLKPTSNSSHYTDWNVSLISNGVGVGAVHNNSTLDLRSIQTPRRTSIGPCIRILLPGSVFCRSICEMGSISHAMNELRPSVMRYLYIRAELLFFSVSGLVASRYFDSYTSYSPSSEDSVCCSPP